MELELVLKKELLQSGCELAPEDATQRGDGQEESSRGGDPSGTVGCKTASRNNVVYVRMMVKVLSPSVEYAKKPDVRPAPHDGSMILWRSSVARSFFPTD